MAVASLLAGCRGLPGPEDFSEADARAHVDMLAGTIGSRPIGSAANARARDYLVNVLQNAGFQVRLQRAEGVDDRTGAGIRRVTAPTVNIIAWHDGARREAVALVTHYDSVPEGPGALDDALGVAVVVESAKRLVSASRRHSLFVVITDGEEAGLLGARAAVRDPEVASRVRAFLNFDGTGAAGPLLMFEAGPGRGSALDAWAEAAPLPEGASFTTEIYRRLPNDTDFTALKTIDGVSGINFAPVLDSYGYHTDRDVPSRVRSSTLRHGILNTVAIVQALDRADLSVREGSPTFFSLFGRFVVIVDARATALIAWVGAAGAATAWILLLVLAARACGWLRVALTLVWSGVTALAAFGAAVGATSLLRALRGQLNPWYAAPLGYFLWMVVAGTLAGWIVRHLSLRVPQRLQPWPSSMAVWLLAFPVWAALAVAAVRLAPNASYLVSIPLLLAAVSISTIRERGRVAALVVLIAAGSLWIQNLILLARFLVSMFGWFPIVAPAWMFPAVIGAGALMVVPPLVGSLPDSVRRALRASSAGMAVMLLFLLTGVMAYRAPAFTEDRPEARSVRYVQDGPRGAAWWEVASLEPRFRLDGGPDGAEWQEASAPLETSASLVLRRPAPFVFRTRAALPSEAPPLAVEATTSALSPGEIAYDVTVTVRPTRDPAVVELALPRGAAPLESSLGGSVGRDGTWRAAYVSPPAEGLRVRLVVAAEQRDALQNAIVILQVPGVPGGGDPRRLPAWLPTVATTWRAYSWYLVSAAPAAPAR